MPETYIIIREGDAANSPQIKELLITSAAAFQIMNSPEYVDAILPTTFVPGSIAADASCDLVFRLDDQHHWKKVGDF